MRTLDDIQKEYQQLCFSLGHFQSQLKGILIDADEKKKEIEAIETKIIQLMNEAKDLKAKETKNAETKPNAA